MRKIYYALKYVCIAALVISLVALLAVVAYVLINGLDKLSFHLVFGEYDPNMPTLLPALVGTLQLIGVAAIIAIPIGVASAIFLVEYTNNKGKFVKIVQVAAETLAGIPSIVYGLFGYLIFVVAFGWGYSIIGGGITLAIMILPTIVRSTQESLLSVQGGLREGAYALGTSKVRTIFRIVLPSAAGGIVTAIILAIGRVVSESAVLILTIGMVVNKVPETLMSPGTSLALDIYYFASHGYPNEAAATAVVLLVFVILLNLLAGWIGNMIKKSTYGDAK
ncbi:MAG: phosphate ABC transporter permease PstA [Clostridia bacterium]|nr:phosphate ABC transporter permease PstA [Clostridia bacterium]